MRILKTTERLGEPCCAALGYFDGVHIGHATVLGAARERARALGIPFAVFTFYFEGERLHSKGRGDILTLSERINRISKAGADAVYLLPFEEIRGIAPNGFVKRILHDTMMAKAVFTGEDFHFGAAGEGDTALLKKLCAEYGIEAVACPRLTDRGEDISSTRIKLLLEAGDIAAANRLLGSPYSFILPVVHGDGRGRTLGFATANQALPAEVLVPKRGVYLSRCTIDGEQYYGITNIGSRPTFYDNGETLVETNLLGLCESLYDRYLEVALIAYLRDERRFDTPEALEAQLAADTEAAKKIIKETENEQD